MLFLTDSFIISFLLALGDCIKTQQIKFTWIKWKYKMLLEFQITEKPKPGNFHISTSASVIIICLICSPLDKLEQLKRPFFFLLATEQLFLGTSRLAQEHISYICWEKTFTVHCSPFRLRQRVWNSNQSQIYLFNLSGQTPGCAPGHARASKAIQTRTETAA